MILTYLNTWPSSFFTLPIYNSLSRVLHLPSWNPLILLLFFFLCSLTISQPPTHHSCYSVSVFPLLTQALLIQTLFTLTFLYQCSCKLFINLFFLPLQYASAGCLLSLHHSEKPEHEEVCEFRPYTCPCPGASCKWQGSLEAVMPHLMHAHKSITTLQGEDIVFLATDINLPGAVDWVMMQSCFGHHFMLVLEKQEKYEGHQQFFAIVLLIGTRKQAENFAYRLELNGNRRRLTWEATPRSIHDGVAAAIMNSDCLVFDTSIAHLFADNGNLGINVTISMCWGGSIRLFLVIQTLDNLCSLSDCRFWRQQFGDVYILYISVQESSAKPTQTFKIHL